MSKKSGNALTETQYEIEKLWQDWPERHHYVVKVNDIGSGALCFFGWVWQTQPIRHGGTFGPGDPYQMIKTWVTRWEATYGQMCPPKPPEANE